ncbi:hypothetical protein [Pontivivens ytuae]|uniref:Uncharacterized protein n=1 Tax=Pontivivens ytuae TaxID=2789856 RepID=A0A7S9LU80_9RHOB|nr:hypothetical protein [Pontivivens ytuae]QPH54840.1 hypothetical protein I0K15_03460 [Pontivivens ytuae]
MTRPAHVLPIPRHPRRGPAQVAGIALASGLLPVLPLALAHPQAARLAELCAADAGVALMLCALSVALFHWRPRLG